MVTSNSFMIFCQCLARSLSDIIAMRSSCTSVPHAWSHGITQKAYMYFAVSYLSLSYVSTPQVTQNICRTFVQCWTLVHTLKIRHAYPMLDYCWSNVADGRPALNQHRVNVNMLLQISTVLLWMCKSSQINGCEVTVSQIYNRFPWFLEKNAQSNKMIMSSTIRYRPSDIELKQYLQILVNKY